MPWRQGGILFALQCNRRCPRFLPRAAVESAAGKFALYDLRPNTLDSGLKKDGRKGLQGVAKHSGGIQFPDEFRGRGVQIDEFDADDVKPLGLADMPHLRP